MTFRVIIYCDSSALVKLVIDELDSVELRCLDALHLAAALRLGSALGTMVSYDERMLNAAKKHGVAVAHSGWLAAERDESS